MAGGLDDLTHDELLAFSNSYIATVSGDLASYPGLVAADMTRIGGMRDDYGDSILDADQKGRFEGGDRDAEFEPEDVDSGAATAEGADVGERRGGG